MHRSYVAEVTGGCLGAAMPDGMNLTVDTTERIEPLSLVCIVLKKSAGPWSSFMQAAWFEAMDGAWPGVMVKLYLGRGRANGRDVLLLGQLCPPCIGVVGLDEIEAAHRTTGQHQGFLKIVPGDADYEAYQMIAAFAGKER